jgi:type VI protein secretion system component Hcp
MSEEKTRPEAAKATELSEQDLNKVAGGQDSASPKLHEATAPTVSEIVITKTTDSSSPNLF